jgi:predicted DNA-binding transcriptional regulator AlpA
MNPAYSVAEFCRQHGISRGLFYTLLRDGRGPRTMKLGSRTLITAEAAAEWRQRMEAATQNKEAA